MKKRIISSIIIALIFIPVFLLGGLFFKLFCGVLGILAFNEIISLPKFRKLPSIIKLLGMFSLILLMFVTNGYSIYLGVSYESLIISFIALSTIIPSSSVFVGPYQFAYILALNIYHIEKSNALGIAFIHQITIMITITIISVIYFMISNTSIKELRTEIDENNNSLSEVKKNDGNTQS